MRVVIIEHHNAGHRRVFEGRPEEVRQDLLHCFPWLARRHSGATAERLVTELDRGQAYTAVIDNGDVLLRAESDPAGAIVMAAQLGEDEELADAISAAAFLAGTPRPTPEAVRQALLTCDERPLEAALVSVGLDTDPATLAALRGILATVLGSTLSKAEPAPPPREVVAVTPDGEKFAAEVKRALAAGQVVPVSLGGRHSAGTMVAYDPETHRRLLLKPGSGPQNPSAGDTESASSQAKREVAFWGVMQAWGLGDAGPEAHLLLLDGREYAAMRMLPNTFRSFNELRRQDPGLPRRLLRLYLHDGTLHKWAALYYVLGEVDGNAGNVMARGEEVQLIDHGSAFAGRGFAPATDRDAFTPYYLRAWAPEDYLALPPVEKLRALPRLPAQAEPGFKAWLQGLDRDAMTAVLFRYGIEADPSRARLVALQESAQHVPADLAVLQAWVLP